MPPPRSRRASTRTRDAETTARNVVADSRAAPRARARASSSSTTPAFSARIIRELDLALADADAHASSDAGDAPTATTTRRRGKRKIVLTLARAERLWERAIERGGATETNAEATVRAIANGGGRGCGGGVVVDDDAARFLLAKVTSTFGEEEEGSIREVSKRSRGSRSGTKRNLSARFEQTASEGDDDDRGDGGDAEATSERRGVKRRKLSLAERMVRRVELTMTRSTSKELRIIDGRRFDRAMCAIVDDGVENVGKVDLACAKALEMSAKATGSRSFGITPVGLQTMRMVVDGGFGDAYAFTVAADAKRHLSALIEAEERLGPEIADVPVKKRRRLARVLMNLSNFARPPQYRRIEGEQYDEAACHIADVSMETSGRIDLACAKAIHASVRDGGSHWGITEIELRTLKMLARGGRGDLTVKLEAAAKRYLETVVEKEETLSTTTTTTTTTTTEEDTESDDESSSKRAKTGVFTHLKKLVRRKQYRYVDGRRFDEDACNIADDSMERIGRIDLECAKTIHASILDGGSRWGITATEYATVRLFIDGGRDDVLYICDDDAKLYLLNVLGTQAVEEAANVTPPTKVHVRQAPASALQSALKNPPPSALKTAAKSAAKKKGVIFTPSRRFQTRTYVPSPTSGNSDEEVENDTDEEDETNDDVVDSRLEETREEDDEEEDEDFEPIKRASDDALTVYAPSIMTAFYDSMQFWMTPVSVLDTAAACIVTLAVFCVAHVAIIAMFEATIAPASVTVLTKTETSM